MKWTEVRHRADRHVPPLGFGMDRPLQTSLHSLSAQLTAQSKADKDTEKYSGQGIEKCKEIKEADERDVVGEEKRNAAF